MDGTRRIIVRLAFLVYLLFLMEGAIRKWGLPQYQQLFFFMRDPFLLAIYAIYLRWPASEKNAFFPVWMVFAVLATLMGGLGHLVHGGGMLAWIFGVRSYFLYMPLAFVIGHVFSSDDVGKFVRLNLVIAVPIAFLVAVQYYSPTDAFVNRSIRADEPVTTVVEGVVRPYGLFTYTGQQVFFAASLISVLATAWLLRKEIGVNRRLLVLGAFAVMFITLLTGSRAIYFIAAQIGVMLFLAAAASGQREHRARARTFVFLFVIGAAMLFATVLNAALEDILERQSGAGAAEGGGYVGTLGRAIDSYIGFFRVLGEVPILGYGIGAGTNAAMPWVAPGVGPLPEGELERVVAELGPVLGLCLIGLRFVFVFFLLARSWRAARAGNPAGLAFLGFAWGIFTAGSMTWSTNIGCFAWLYAGLVLASTRQPSPLANPTQAFSTKEKGSVPHAENSAWRPHQPSHSVSGTLVPSARSTRRP